MGETQQHLILHIQVFIMSYIQFWPYSCWREIGLGVCNVPPGMVQLMLSHAERSELVHMVS